MFLIRSENCLSVGIFRHIHAEALRIQDRMTVGRRRYNIILPIRCGSFDIFHLRSFRFAERLSDLPVCKKCSRTVILFRMIHSRSAADQKTQNFRSNQRSETAVCQCILRQSHLCRHKRVPLPIICQNFVLERTFLKNTKFTHSGTSMPVSIISTETAIKGVLSGCLKSSIIVCE